MPPGYPGCDAANRCLPVWCGHQPGGYRHAVGGNVQLEEQLAGLDYPVSKEDLLRRAQETGVDTEVLETIRSLPVDWFTSQAQLSEALGEQQ
jgi:hypothetical protein